MDDLDGSEQPQVLHPWDRRPEELHTHWDAFQAYRDLGPGRSLVSAIERYLTEKGGRSTVARRRATALCAASKDQARFKRNMSKTWSKWGVRHDWVNRVNAYDDYQHELEEQERFDRTLAERSAAIEAEIERGKARIQVARLATELVAKTMAHFARLMISKGGVESMTLDDFLTHSAKLGTLLAISMREEREEARRQGLLAGPAASEAEETRGAATAAQIGERADQLARIIYDEMMARYEAEHPFIPPADPGNGDAGPDDPGPLEDPDA